MSTDGPTGHDEHGDGVPFVLDETWARAGTPESSQRRRISPPPHLPAGANITGAPAGPRDWSPPASTSTRGSQRGRAWPVLIVGLIALAVLAVTFGVSHRSGPNTVPIAQPTGDPAAPSVADTEPQVAGLTASRSVGSCFDLHGSGVVVATFVPCSQRHHLQLVGIETAAGRSDQFPADLYWNGPVRRRCVADLAHFSGQPQRRWPPRLTATQFIPLHSGWATGDRTVYCVGRESPSQRTSLRHLRPFRGRHPAIAQAPRSSSTVTIPPPAMQSRPASDQAIRINGKLGLMQVGTQVCLDVINSSGAVVIEPSHGYGEIWQINNGTPDRVRSGITRGTHPSSNDIVRHLGADVSLAGQYSAAMPESCGAVRQFNFSAVH